MHVGNMYVGMLRNDSEKMIVNGRNQLVSPPLLPERRTMSLEKASMEIVRSIEKRIAVKVFSPLGKFLYLTNRVSPLIVKKLLSLNMRIMERSCMSEEYLYDPQSFII